MGFLEKLETFMHGEPGMSFYQNFTIYGFWVSIPICLFIVFLIFRMDKKYKARKNEIKKMIHSPGMEDVRWLLKGRLKNHGIEPDENIHKKN